MKTELLILGIDNPISEVESPDETTIREILHIAKERKIITSFEAWWKEKDKVKLELRLPYENPNEN